MQTWMGSMAVFRVGEAFKTSRTLFPSLSQIVFLSRITYVPAEHLEEFRVSFGQQSGGMMALDIFSSYTGR